MRCSSKMGLGKRARQAGGRGLGPGPGAGPQASAMGCGPEHASVELMRFSRLLLFLRRKPSGPEAAQGGVSGR